MTLKTITLALLVAASLGGTAAAIRWHGIQLPNRVLVDAWNPSDSDLVKQMRDYVRDLAGQNIAKGGAQ